jgi:hypothetical protein
MSDLLLLHVSEGLAVNSSKIQALHCCVEMLRMLYAESPKEDVGAYLLSSC